MDVNRPPLYYQHSNMYMFIFMQNRLFVSLSVSTISYNVLVVRDRDFIFL